jgi:hypothetical protein
LNEEQRFVLILDGFDEMKFAMAPNEFNYISSEIRKVSAVNSKLLLLGRPGSIETEDEERRLTSSRLHVQNLTLRADEAPDFASLRLSSLSEEQYLRLIRNFLALQVGANHPRSIDDIISNVESLDLGDILSRPVQAKMLAEVAADPAADISSLSRFTLYDMFIRRALRREEEKSARQLLGAADRIDFMRLLAWWLWTEKKTRTFAANEIPMDIIRRFEVSGVPLEGLRRELLIGSIIEEKNVGGHFLAEKTAGVFYFPHTSFTEFLVADYIMSANCLNIDVTKLPTALYGEVPTFLNEHPSKDAIFAVFNRMKAAQIAMSTPCMTVLLNDFTTRMHVELVSAKCTEAWDICLHYLLLHAQNVPAQARQFALDCLASPNRSTEMAAMFCLMYEDSLNRVGHGSGTARMTLHIFRKIGMGALIAAAERGSTSVHSSELNHLAEIVTGCIRIAPRDLSVSFDFAEFTTIALSFISTSCAVSDVLESMRKTYSIPGNDLLALCDDSDERALLGELLRKGGDLKVIPSL